MKNSLMFYSLVCSLTLAIFGILADLGLQKSALDSPLSAPAVPRQAPFSPPAAPLLKADNMVNLGEETSHIIDLPRESAQRESSESKRRESADKIAYFDKEISRLEAQHRAFEGYGRRAPKRNYDTPTSSEAADYEDNLEPTPPTQKAQPQESTAKPQPQKPRAKGVSRILKDSRPKVVIIIDDIANKHQLDALRAINLRLTPSIFPVAKNNAAMLGALDSLDFFMVHLPLEAKRYSDELDTIKLGEPPSRLERKIAAIKEAMPRARYINNHTGSRFTANKAEMRRLLGVLDAHNLYFVDSRTTPETTLNAIAKEDGRLILSRDIFIDNSLESGALNARLKEGVALAKERGYAILIAHPHKETLKALNLAAEGLLKEVDVVYLNELESLLKNAQITTYTQSILK